MVHAERWRWGSYFDLIIWFFIYMCQARLLDHNNFVLSIIIIVLLSIGIIWEERETPSPPIMYYNEWMSIEHLYANLGNDRLIDSSYSISVFDRWSFILFFFDHSKPRMGLRGKPLLLLFMLVWHAGPVFFYQNPFLYIDLFCIITAN